MKLPHPSFLNNISFLVTLRNLSSINTQQTRRFKSFIRMPLNLIRSILNTITVSFGPQVIVSDTLNPIHLALSTRGYWFQSHILSIPDRYGFFSPGPPRLQAYQGFLSLILFIMIVCEIFLGTFVIFLASLKPDRKPIWVLIPAISASAIGVVAFIWAGSCFHENRRPDYDWADWKLRKD